MPDRATIGLDNPAFQGRLRQPDRPHAVTAQRAPYPSPVRHKSNANDVRLAQPVIQTVSQPHPAPIRAQQPPAPVTIVQPQRFAEPAQPRQRSSKVLKRHTVHFPRRRSTEPTKKTRSHSKTQLSLVAVAVIALVFGMGASVQTIRINHINRDAAAQVSALSQKANVATAAAAAAVPSTTKPTSSAVSDYVVASNLPRYLKIPKLGVDARVLQAGVTSTGVLGTPPNVYDTAWYTGSAEPGQPGVTLIDGHVASSTNHGVFYGLNTLAPGDLIQIITGNGTLYDYQVMKTQIYSAGNDNMQAAMTPITAGRDGLNLITCTGDVIPGTSVSNEQLIVFAQQV